MNILNGGAHAANNIDIQEFMIVPQIAGKKFSEQLRAGVEIFHHLKTILKKKNLSTNVGDEGGFAPDLNTHHVAMDLLCESIERAGYKVGNEIKLSLDVAASEFYQESSGLYEFEQTKRTAAQMINYYKDLLAKYPVYSIEDGLAEGDRENWKKMTQELGEKTYIIGDDLFVTNPKIYREGIKEHWANAILIKLNQIGTVSETLEAFALAIEAGHKAIASHRSGETADSFIADLSVATSCGLIKTGSACRTDRTEKYNQLLRIEELLEQK